MSWRRLEVVKYRVGTALHLDTRCRIEATVVGAGSDAVVVLITGPDEAWDGCPDVYHDEGTGEPSPMATRALLEEEP